MATDKLFALIGRHGDVGGRYTSRQWGLMKAAAWVLYCSGSLVQVWRALPNGDLLSYDADATRRVNDYIVKARKSQRG